MTNNAASEMKFRRALLGSFLDEHHGRIAEHYAHAIEKHPYFCDWVGTKNDAAKVFTAQKLEESRMTLSDAIKHHYLAWDDLLDCEMWEVFEALASGDKSHAVEELYDMVAVCLRTIDVLEGRQSLGKPEEGGEA